MEADFPETIIPGMTNTASSTDAGVMKILTIDDLREAEDQLRRIMADAPPRPDRRFCSACHEEMGLPAMNVVSGESPFAIPLAFLCGRCAYLLKMKLRADLR